MKPASNIAWIVLGVVACTEAPTAELLVPHTTPVRWAETYDAPDDGVGALVPVDLMAYDSVSGEPWSDMAITVWAEGENVWPVPDTEPVAVDPDVCVTCELWFDGEGDDFIEPLAYRSGLTLRTDDDGLVRLFVFVDAFPSRTAEGNPADLAVFATMGTLEESFVLTPR